MHPEGALEVISAASVLHGGVLNVASTCYPHRRGRSAEQCRSDAAVGVRDGAELLNVFITLKLTKCRSLWARCRF